MSDLNIFRQWKQLAELQGRDFDLGFNAVASSESKARPINECKKWLMLTVALVNDIKKTGDEKDFSKEFNSLLLALTEN